MNTYRKDSMSSDFRVSNYERDLYNLSLANNKSFFRSEIWQGCLAEFARIKTAQVVLTALCRNSNPLICAQIGLGKSRILKYITQKSAYFCSFGDLALDVICTEDCQPNLSPLSTTDDFVFYLNNIFDKFKLNTLEFFAVGEDFYKNLKSANSLLRYFLKIEKSSVSYHVNLKNLEKNHLQSLSHAVRRKIKKTTENLSKKFGPISMNEPTDIEQAYLWFDQMAELNIVKFQSRNLISSFNNPFLTIFHKKLMADYFTTQLIFIRKFQAGEQILGYIYGFNFDNRFYAYQSGFRENLMPATSVGLLCHSLLIEDLRLKNFSVYDFLAGDYHYKKELSNDTKKLYWLSLRKPSALVWLDAALRKAKSSFNKT